MLVVIKWERNKYPQFGCIHAISISNDNTIYFLLKKLNTVNFNTHYHAYEVLLTNEWHYLKISDLAVHIPTNIRVTVDCHRLVPFCFAL